MFKSKEKFSIKKLLREGISRYQYLYINRAVILSDVKDLLQVNIMRFFTAF